MDATQSHDEITITIDESGDLKMLETAMARLRLSSTSLRQRLSKAESLGQND